MVTHLERVTPLERVILLERVTRREEATKRALQRSIAAARCTEAMGMAEGKVSKLVAVSGIRWGLGEIRDGCLFVTTISHTLLCKICNEIVRTKYPAKSISTNIFSFIYTT